MTWVELVREEALRCGVALDDDEAAYVLWNHTGFPSFYDGDREIYFRAQVRRWCTERLTAPCWCEVFPCLTTEETLAYDEGLHHPGCAFRGPP